MEWIKTILPLIGVALGWLLSESGKIFADKRQDKKKLKKLLFFLLELRYHFARELSIELNLDNFIDKITKKTAQKFGMSENDPEISIGINAQRPLIGKLLIQNKNQDEKFEYLSENIDKILIDLAEIFPILAYELNGQHNIKERLNRFENYLNEFKSVTDEIPFDLKQWINPKMTKDLLKDLDDSIDKIAKQIDNETLNTSREKIKEMNFDSNDSEMDMFIDEYFEKVMETI